MDPVTLETLSNAIHAITMDMCEFLAANALSAGIRHSGACSAALYSTQGDLMAVSGCAHLHPGPMPSSIYSILKIHPFHSISPGDFIITNDPCLSGSQLPWVYIISSIYSNNRPLALAVSAAHYSDMGGSVPGSIYTQSREIFQDGLRIPPIKIVRKGEPNHDIESLIHCNVRTAQEFSGDMKAQFSAGKLAEKRLRHLAVKYGVDRIKGCLPEIMSFSERSLRSVIKMLPLTVYSLKSIIQADGFPDDPINIDLKVIRDGDSLTFDFTGTHPQVTGPVNITRETTLSCVHYAVKRALGKDIPLNAGFTRPVRVITPEGSLVNPVLPAPLALGGIITARKITGMVAGCLWEAVPDGVQAAESGSVIGLTAGGMDKSTGNYYSYTDTLGGGQNSSSGADGIDGNHAGLPIITNIPAEVIENHYPIMINQWSLVKNSGGPGKFRGGAGIQKSITLLQDNTTVSVLAGSIAGGRGCAGGLPGMPGRVVISRPFMGDDASICVEAGIFTGILEKGSTITLESAGGGGFGSPLERDPERVRLDVLEGFVSRDQAAEIYGVILTGNDEIVDDRATGEKRKNLAKGSL
ncbi:MAG: hypothetical protein VR68_10440 [Peptococcaceae bacterium BRH_c4a]|nr:MAG: hypothetical protein VR68_10440 [Peptococcaceae bacterium BRH_c4a]